VSGKRGQADDVGQARACGLPPQTKCPADNQMPASRQRGHVVAYAVATVPWQLVRRAAGRGVQGHCCRRSRPSPGGVSMIGVRSALRPRRLCGTGTADMSGCGRLDGCGNVRCPVAPRDRGRVSGRHRPPRTLPHPAGVRRYRKRSSARRPLLGAATAAKPAGPPGRAAGGAARARRSCPAAPAPGPPRPSARRAGGP
jgi:hypothetical protein